jgi:protein gp37
LPRIDHLREADPAMAFLSIEPLLEDLGEFDLNGIEWVIVGGESGAGARPMKPEWVRQIRRQCRAANVPFFFKQWGGVRKRMTGRELDGRTFDEMPDRTPAQPLSAERRKSLAAEYLAAWPQTRPRRSRRSA